MASGWEPPIRKKNSSWTETVSIFFSFLTNSARFSFQYVNAIKFVEKMDTTPVHTFSRMKKGIKKKKATCSTMGKCPRWIRTVLLYLERKKKSPPLPLRNGFSFALGPRENGLSSHRKKKGKEKKNLSARPEILIKLYNEPFPSQKLGA